MGINAAMQAGVSGLAANATALSAISNNIANVNTTAYKRVRSDFAAIVTSSSTPTGYNAGGVQATTRHTISQLGTLQATSNELDIGIEGQGFFVTTQASDAKPSDAHLFTRDGSFTTDRDGFLRNSTGLYLQGWPVGPTGVANTTSSDLSQLETINITNIGGQAEATTQAIVGANFNAASTIDTTYNLATNSMHSYNPTAVPIVGTKPNLTISIPVSDSLGGERVLSLSAVKTGINSWSYELTSPDAAAANGLVSSGTLNFNTAGELVSPLSLALNFPWKPALGLDPQTMNVNLNDAKGGLTQLNASSAPTQVTANGTAFGELAEVKIGEDGMVTAIFKNGTTRDVAQVALATFMNADGLIPVSGNAYTVSNTSGSYILKEPGNAGAGFLKLSALESSEVDLSQEFTGLIVTQRAYSASSKIITTADEMLQELLSIKR
jgi:flagellar hook protein FlgE